MSRETPDRTGTYKSRVISLANRVYLVLKRSRRSHKAGLARKQPCETAMRRRIQRRRVNDDRAPRLPELARRDNLTSCTRAKFEPCISLSPKRIILYTYQSAFLYAFRIVPVPVFAWQTCAAYRSRDDVSANLFLSPKSNHPVNSHTDIPLNTSTRYAAVGLCA